MESELENIARLKDQDNLEDAYLDAAALEARPLSREGGILLAELVVGLGLED